MKGEKERQGLKMSRIITYSSAVGEPGFEFLFRISPLFFPEHSHGQLFQFVFYLPKLMPMVATCNDRPHGKGRLTKIEAENCLATEVLAYLPWIFATFPSPVPIAFAYRRVDRGCVGIRPGAKQIGKKPHKTHELPTMMVPNIYSPKV